MEFQSRIFLEHEDTTGRGGRPARTGEPQPHTAEMREHTSCTRARYVRLSISRDYRSQRPAQTQITASPSAPFSAIEKEGWRERKAAVQRASARFEARAQVRVAERLRSGSEVDEQMLECAESAHQLALPRLAKARLVRLDEGGARGPREGGTREGLRARPPPPPPALSLREGRARAARGGAPRRSEADRRRRRRCRPRRPRRRWQRLERGRQPPSRGWCEVGEE